MERFADEFLALRFNIFSTSFKETEEIFKLLCSIISKNFPYFSYTNVIIKI